MADAYAPFAAPTKFTDVVLIVEDKKIHVSKQLLAIHSPVFDAMFFGEFAEKGKEEVEIKDVVFEEFVDLMNLIHPGHTPITKTSVEYILKLGDRFQMKHALEESEAFMLNTDDLSIGRKLLIADQYNLRKSRDLCLDSIKCVNDVKFKVLGCNQGGNL